MYRSIWRRIWIPYTLLILMLLASLGIYLSATLRTQYLEELRSKIAVDARLLREAITPQFQDHVDAKTINRLAHYYAEIIQARVTIIDIDGEVLGDSDSDPSTMENHASRPEVAEAKVKGVGTSTRFSATTGYQTYYYASILRLEGTPVAIVRIALPLSQIESNQFRLQGTIIGTTVFASAIAIFLALWIARGVTQPLRQLSRAALEMVESQERDTDLPERLYSDADGELGQLSHAFNRMAQRITLQHESLENERTKLSTLLQAMNDAALIVDAAGSVEMINPSAETMFSVRSDEVIGHSLAEGLRHHQIVELWQKSLGSGKSEHALIEISTERLFLQSVAQPLMGVHESSTLLLFNNLTRQRFLETVRRDFVSNLSHELRTPLASLKALTETLQSGALDDPPAARRFLERMETEVDALSQMVTELLELARIESGRVPMQMAPVSPGDVIASAVDRLRLQAERARLSLTVECPETLPDIQADLTRLEQVLVNLLHNAIKFTLPGGSIHVIAQAENDDGGKPFRVVFSVHDTGVGIASEDLPRIFERFYKADRARSSGGTGLGLAIARHTVEAHGGRIWAESIQGQGSTFYFDIPVAQV